uniref:BHLH domain-containing protein n=1 Tax=Brassica campestris TaxID=3711 RepID=A0A679KP54_BRACM|nr:Unknown [Brassica rapa]CAA8287786.1 Unknown [Brassica rapa]CAA8392403.1 Unknown [Brassica rapa]CAA8404071.1 Unknown [Brassica rapa]
MKETKEKRQKGLRVEGRRHCECRKRHSPHRDTHFRRERWRAYYLCKAQTSESTFRQAKREKETERNQGEDDIVELLWKSGQVVESSQTQRPPVPPPILRGSGSGGGGGEESAPLPPPPPLHSHQQQPSDDQNLFIGEDEMASWLLHHPLREEDQFHSHLFYSGVVSAVSSTQPQASVSLTPPQPPAANTVYTPTATERPMGQAIAARRAESVFNFWRLRENIHNTRGRVEAAAAPWVPVVKDSTQVGSSATPSSSVATATSGVLQAFAVPSLCQRGVETVCEVAGPSSSVVSKTETELLGIETEAGDDERKRKEREEPADDTEETGEEARGSTSRKRSRAAEMHNISQRRRREKINEKMKALQELIPRCNKMMSMGSGGMMPMMYTPNMQRFMPSSAMGMMGVNRPPFVPFPGMALPRPAHMEGLGPPYPPPRYPFPNVQAFDPSRVHLPTPQPDSNQPQFPGYVNPYSQFVGLQHLQQPPPPPQLQNQSSSQLSFSQASSSKEPEDQDSGNVLRHF